ncbi:methylase of polypeptide subunit release factors [Massilia sp. UYP11]|jgi:methylase of polypeptide subunit release factors|uniref:hypothetical protein n=1 Tax=Massilia sp. UYP11 TaxID=1756385 RepID=UPI003D251013
MDFPSTDCERQVLKRLKVQGSFALSFGVMHYIHAACQAGFPSSMTALHCARLLAWPKIFQKLRDKFPELADSSLIEKELRELHLNKGINSKFLERLSQFLEAAGGHEKEVRLLEERIKQRTERRKVWDAAMAASAEAHNPRFEHELLLDYEVFNLSLEQAQRELMRMADAEDHANGQTASITKATLT